MDRKLGSLVSVSCLVLVAITFIDCSVAMTKRKLENDLKVNLDAFEVRKNATKRNEARNNKPGKYFPFFVILKRAYLRNNFFEF